MVLLHARTHRHTHTHRHTLKHTLKHTSLSHLWDKQVGGRLRGIEGNGGAGNETRERRYGQREQLAREVSQGERPAGQRAKVSLL